MDLKLLLYKLAVDDPRCTSTEGLDDCCHFCESYSYKIHYKDCAWMEARITLELPLFDNKYTDKDRPYFL